jgi:hypothetical protein
MLNFTITEINWLILFREIMDPYTENYTNKITLNAKPVDVAASVAYSYHRAFKG